VIDPVGGEEQGHGRPAHRRPVGQPVLAEEDLAEEAPDRPA
jgi:hypothetical protein